MQARFSLLTWALLLSLIAHNLPAAVSVTNTNNSGAGSLRQAISDVNGGAASGPIDFAAGVTGTINLTNALPTINTNVTINGPGAAVLTVRRSSGTNYPIFNIGPFTVNIYGLTIANGNGFDPVPIGGGVQDFNSTLTISDCVFSNNAAWYGGAIGNNTTALTVSNCVFWGNRAHSANGGAIYHSSAFPLNVAACTFSGNTATNGFGGAIHCAGDANVNNSTFSNNVAQSAGAIRNDGGNFRLSGSTFVNNKAVGGGSIGQSGGAAFLVTSSVISNCTFSGNTARGSGGALCLSTNVSGLGFTAEVSSVTITLNTADILGLGGQFGGFGGGVRVDGRSAIRFRNSIIASNLLGSTDVNGRDLSGTNFPSAGYNLVGKTNGATWLVATGDRLGSSASPINPMLGPLQNNGGPTWTHAPLSGSPAIDRGKSFGLATDQRGRVRPFDFTNIANAADGSDIGAVEVQAPHVLNIAQTSNSVLLFWSTNDPDFMLESKTNLSNPTWSPEDLPVIVSGQYTVTNTPSGEQRFYRLRQ